MLKRRDFLGDVIKTGGALVVGFRMGGVELDAQSGTAQRPVVAGPPDARQIDTWLAIHEDNTATIYIGFAEPAGAAYDSRLSRQLPQSRRRFFLR